MGRRIIKESWLILEVFFVSARMTLRKTNRKEEL